MKINLKKTLFFAFLVVVSLSACDTFNSVGQQRAGVFLTIDEIELNTGAGSLARVDEETGNITANSDTVKIVFHNRPKSTRQTDSPWMDIITEEYQVTFYRIDGGTVVPNSLRRRLTVTVEFDNTYTVPSLTMLSAEQKIESPLWELAVNGYDAETGLPVIEMNVMIEVFGKTTSGEQVYAYGWTSIAYGVTVE